MKNILNKHLNKITCVFIALLVLFGFYKNGISLYIKNYITLLEMFKPLLLVFISISGAVIGSFIGEKRKHKKIKLNYLDNLKSTIIESAIFACVLPINTSPIILFVLTLIIYMLFYKIKINKIAISFIVISIINRLLDL